MRPTCLGATGNVEWWQAQAFRVDEPGSYTLDMTESGRVGASSGGDGYFLLYEAPFDYADPQTNCLAVNDDTHGLRPSITAELSANVDYVLVTTQCCDGTSALAQMT